MVTICAAVLALAVGASDMVAAETIPAGEKIAPGLVDTAEGTPVAPDAELFSREARRTIYAGQTVTLDNTRPVRLVERNQIVSVSFRHGGLEITMPARAMGAAAQGEWVKVMNTQTREMLSGIVQDGGWVLVK